jgi:GNAT superfamily N-acetyltransferase
MVRLGFGTMSEITIQPCTVTDIVEASTYEALIAAYAAESALDEMPAPEPDIAMYHALEASGSLKIVGAFCQGQLVGFIACNMNYAPQYAAIVGLTMVFFVDQAHRTFGTGARMVEAMKHLAKAHGAVGLMIGAPAESRLAKAAPILGFKETNRLYFKAI